MYIRYEGGITQISLLRRMFMSLDEGYLFARVVLECLATIPCLSSLEESTRVSAKLDSYDCLIIRDLNFKGEV